MERISPEITQRNVCPKCAIGVYSNEQFIKQHVEWNGNDTTKWMLFNAISKEYFFVGGLNKEAWCTFKHWVVCSKVISPPLISDA